MSAGQKLCNIHVQRSVETLACCTPRHFGSQCNCPPVPTRRGTRRQRTTLLAEINVALGHSSRIRSALLPPARWVRLDPRVGWSAPGRWSDVPRLVPVLRAPQTQGRCTPRELVLCEPNELQRGSPRQAVALERYGKQRALEIRIPHVLHAKCQCSVNNGRVPGEQVDGLGLGRHVPCGHVERDDLCRPVNPGRYATLKAVPRQLQDPLQGAANGTHAADPRVQVVFLQGELVLSAKGQPHKLCSDARPPTQMGYLLFRAAELKRFQSHPFNYTRCLHNAGWEGGLSNCAQDRS